MNDARVDTRRSSTVSTSSQDRIHIVCHTILMMRESLVATAAAHDDGRCSPPRAVPGIHHTYITSVDIGLYVIVDDVIVVARSNCRYGQTRLPQHSTHMYTHIPPHVRTYIRLQLRGDFDIQPQSDDDVAPDDDGRADDGGFRVSERGCSWGVTPAGLRYTCQDIYITSVDIGLCVVVDDAIVVTRSICRHGQTRTATDAHIAQASGS